MPTGRLSHDNARSIVDAVASSAAGPVSVVVADDHGEVIASLRMDGAALDTPGEVDERLALDAIRAAGLDPPA